jgi:hypothetical protein
MGRLITSFLLCLSYFSLSYFSQIENGFSDFLKSEHGMQVLVPLSD